MTPTVGDIIELVLEGEFDDTEDVFNVFQFQVTQNGWTDEDDYFEDLKELAEALINVIKVVSSALVVWRRLRARNKTTSSAAIQLELDAPIAGSGASNPLPPGSAYLIGFRTSESGILLRKFIGVPIEDANDSTGQWSATTIGLLTDIADLLLAEIVTNHGGFQYGHKSTKSLAWLVPTGAYVSAEPAYQRRRRRGSGS